MTRDEIRLHVLRTLWGWATTECEGVENGELSDRQSEDVHQGVVSFDAAMEIQKEFKKESEKLMRRIINLRNKQKTKRLTGVDAWLNRLVEAQECDATDVK